MQTIYPVLLCGGSGTRLWPLSRKSYPKQFVPLLGEQTLFQASAERLRSFEKPLVITGSDFRFIVPEQLAALGIDPGAILIEPKPQEPTKHQYDYDVATVYGFLKDFGLEDEVQMNIEQGHAILAGHSFEHALAVARELGLFGSIDINRNDYQSGWDTDQFPNNVPEVALCYYHILQAGGLGRGGTNFDAKLRRQSLDAEDLLAAHVGAMDICARGLKAAAAMIADGGLQAALEARYAGWDTAAAQAMLESDLATLSDRVIGEGIAPPDLPLSGPMAEDHTYL